MHVKIIAVFVFLMGLMATKMCWTRIQSEVAVHEVLWTNYHVNKTADDKFFLMNECSPYIEKARSAPGGDAFGLADRANIYYNWAITIDGPLYFRIRLIDEALKSSYQSIQTAPTDFLAWYYFSYGADLYGWTNAAEYARQVSSVMNGDKEDDP